MNIKVFETKKCNDTKKAECFFVERKIKYQFIDMKEIRRRWLFQILRLYRKIP